MTINFIIVIIFIAITNNPILILSHINILKMVIGQGPNYCHNHDQGIGSVTNIILIIYNQGCGAGQILDPAPLRLQLFFKIRLHSNSDSGSRKV